MVHTHVFLYLTAFAQEVLKHRPADGSGISKHDLASVLATVMVRSNKPVAEKYQKLVHTRRTAFVMHFLGSDAPA